MKFVVCICFLIKMLSKLFLRSVCNLAVKKLVDKEVMVKTKKILSFPVQGAGLFWCKTTTPNGEMILHIAPFNVKLPSIHLDWPKCPPMCFATFGNIVVNPEVCFLPKGLFFMIWILAQHLINEFLISVPELLFFRARVPFSLIIFLVKEKKNRLQLACMHHHRCC